MRVAIGAVILATGVGVAVAHEPPAVAQEPSIIERAAAATDADAVAALAAELDARPATDAERWALAVAWDRCDRPERARVVLEALQRSATDPYRVPVLGELARRCEDVGDAAGARARWRRIVAEPEPAAAFESGGAAWQLARTAEDRPPDPHGDRALRATACERVALGFEELAEWDAARRWWERWAPFSGCSTGVAAIQRHRTNAVARCLHRLGRHAAADAGLLAETRVLGSSIGPAWSSAQQLVAQAVESGRLPAVRAAIDGLPAAEQRLFAVPLALADAFVARDRAGIDAVLVRARAAAAGSGPTGPSTGPTTEPSGPQPPRAAPVAPAQNPAPRAWDVAGWERLAQQYRDALAPR